jgi:hypothetical protein
MADTLNELVRASEKAAAMRGFMNGSCVLYPPGASPPSRVGPRTYFEADPRTNSVLVSASPDDVPRIFELIERLDVAELDTNR